MCLDQMNEVVEKLAAVVATYNDTETGTKNNKQLPLSWILVAVVLIVVLDKQREEERVYFSSSSTTMYY